MKPVSALALALMVVLGLSGCPRQQAATPPPSSPPTAQSPAAATPPAPPAKIAHPTGLALGQQIYATGLNASGLHVPFTAGSARFKKNPGGCAGCHGPEGRGHEGFAPATTYSALRSGAKPLYPSDAAVLKAIRSGEDEEGEALSAAMPRWKLTDAEGSALLEQLKALDKGPWNGVATGKKAGKTK